MLDCFLMWKEISFDLQMKEFKHSICLCCKNLKAKRLIKGKVELTISSFILHESQLCIITLKESFKMFNSPPPHLSPLNH